MTIDFESLEKLKDGLDLRIKESSKDILCKRAVVVGVFGQFNKGKSFLISKLSKKNVP